MKLFSIYDSKAEAWDNPMSFRSTGEAIRSFSEIINSAEPNRFNKNPEDFALFELATFDTSTGSLVALPNPHSLGLALNYVTKAAA